MTSALGVITLYSVHTTQTSIEMPGYPHLPVETYDHEFSNGVESFSWILDDLRTPSFIRLCERGDVAELKRWASAACGLAAYMHRCRSIAVKQLSTGQVEIRLSFDPPWWLDNETARSIGWRRSPAFPHTQPQGSQASVPGPADASPVQSGASVPRGPTEVPEQGAG